MNVKRSRIPDRDPIYVIGLKEEIFRFRRNSVCPGGQAQKIPGLYIKVKLTDLLDDLFALLSILPRFPSLV